jgi:hypothetical protein
MYCLPRHCPTTATSVGDALRNTAWTLRNTPWALKNSPWALKNSAWAIRTLPGTGVTEDCPCRTDFKEGSLVNGVFCNARTLEVEAMYVHLSDYGGCLWQMHGHHAPCLALHDITKGWTCVATASSRARLRQVLHQAVFVPPWSPPCGP